MEVAREVLDKDKAGYPLGGSLKNCYGHREVRTNGLTDIRRDVHTYRYEMSHQITKVLMTVGFYVQSESFVFKNFLSSPLR